MSMDRRTTLAKSTHGPGPATAVAIANPVERADIAAYIAQLSGELAGLARTSRFDLLAYFLEMARLEAMSQSGR